MNPIHPNHYTPLEIVPAKEGFALRKRKNCLHDYPDDRKTDDPVFKRHANTPVDERYVLKSLGDNKV